MMKNLSELTTLGIGGAAKEFVEVKTEEELIEAIVYAKAQGLEYLVIGGGSNLLVSDEGVDKLVIKNDIKGIDVIPSNEGIHTNNTPGSPIRSGMTSITAKSGTSLQDLVDFAIANGLSGLQKLTGIPGTVGGAIFGNAGAYGQSISDHLIEVIVIPSNEGIYTNNAPGSPIRSGMTKEKCQFGYRDSIFKKTGDIILEAKFALKPGDRAQMEQEAKDTIAQRLKKYPPGIKCPGSFFKNIVAADLSPEILAKIPQEKIVYGKLPAGVLLELVGAKGDKLGDIEIAPYHANLFINKGGGTAKDFYNLAKKYADLVKTKFGITLEPEVQLINLPDILGAYR